MIKINFNIKEYHTRLTSWQKKHGRNNLPWQIKLNPYSVWVSEIMLQQTQVKTVIPYYNKFLSKFPHIMALAEATEDEVMNHWAGLGYYARARNLHKAAKIIAFDLNGIFPNTFESIIALPGIGKSTSNAILSICYGQATPILDGNVKRIFSRMFAIDKPTSMKPVEIALWEASEKLMPQSNTHTYTQSLMDLGSLLCTRTKPNCNFCPIQNECVAFQRNEINLHPVPKTKKEKPHRTTSFYIYKHADNILLIKNEAKGIWGGLYTLPETLKYKKKPVDIKPVLTKQKHIFTHFTLHYDVTLITLKNSKDIQIEQNQKWVFLKEIHEYPLPAPIKKIFSSIIEQ